MLNKIKEKLWNVLIYLARLEQKIFRPYNVLKLQNCSREYVPHDILIIHSTFAVLKLWIKDNFNDISKFKKYILEKRFEMFSTDKNDEEVKTLLKNLKISSFSLCKQYGKNPNIEQFKNLIILERIYNLCIWYDRTNWNDPVPLSENYKNILNTVTTEYVNNQTVVKMPEGSDGKILAIERSKHIQREKKWQRRLEKNLKSASVILRKLSDDFF